jgi:hypothetical protein
MAYEDLGFRIKDVPSDDPRVPLYSIKNRSDAILILEQAESERPDIHWIIEGDGPCRVRQKI